MVYQNLMTSTISVAIAFGIIVLTRFIIHAMFKKNYVSVNEIEKEGNIAVAIRNGAIYLGIAIAMIGVISTPLTQLIDGLTAMIFVLIAVNISDNVVFSKVNNSIEIGKNNMSLALAEGGLFIGTGIIAMASFSGEGPYVSSIVFFLLGQIVLVLSTIIVEQMYKGIKDKIIDGNLSAGILLGSVIIGLSFVLSSAVAGDFHGWKEDIISFLEYALFGYLLVLVFANKAIDWIFLPTTKIKEQIENNNVSAIIVVSAIKVGIALLISNSL